MDHILIFSFDELYLKGQNQSFYLQTTLQHIRERVHAHHPHKVRGMMEHRRYILQSAIPFAPSLTETLKKIPGVHSFAPARKLPLDLLQVRQALWEELSTHSEYAPEKFVTFKVEAIRSNKSFTTTSMEVGRILGAEILQWRPHWRVNVREPQVRFYVLILDEHIYLYSRRILGVGGLPVGMSGQALTLLSGGFDSPVASYLMAKRGLAQNFVFFFAYPFVDSAIKEKILALAQHLSQYQRTEAKLWTVPFGNLMKKISELAPAHYRTLLFRRFMVEGATLLAAHPANRGKWQTKTKTNSKTNTNTIGAQALVLGDSLGQVASQTIGNLAVIDGRTHLPLYRPLIGFNKVEIINLSKEIGTYNISLQPQDDACSLLAVKHPVTHPNQNLWQNLMETIVLKEELQECIQQAEMITL